MWEPPILSLGREKYFVSSIDYYSRKIYTTSLIFIPSEPVNFKTSLQSPQRNQAMQDGYCALINNRTWTLTPLPLIANIAGCKWIFKNKVQCKWHVSASQGTTCGQRVHSN